MKKLTLLVAVLFTLVSCKNDDDNNTASIDMDLLSGQWFRADLCPSQNNIIFNLDGTYIHTTSGNPCDNNDNDTIQYSGTFEMDGVNLSFNQQSSVVIEEGDEQSISIGDLNTMIAQRIVILTDNELVIEREFTDDPIFQNWRFTR
jgi:hypothetical protein